MDFRKGTQRHLPIADRLLAMSRLDADTGCRVWLASKDEKGYGQVRHDGTCRKAYKVAWVLEHGPVPAGLELDHLCRNPACINPEHLEPVTHKENMRRGMYGQRTACPRGHAYDIVRPNGSRWCKQCDAAAARRYRAERKAS